MITTVGGLIVGILAYFGYNILSASISNVVFKMENSTVEFLDTVLTKQNLSDSEQE